MRKRAKCGLLSDITLMDGNKVCLASMMAGNSQLQLFKSLR